MARYYGTDLNTAASQGFDLGVEGAQKKRKSVEEQEALLAQRGWDIQKLLAGEAYKRQGETEKATREGSAKAAGMNALLSGDLNQARRVGRTQGTPDQWGEEEGAGIMPGNETYVPLPEGAAGGHAADFLQKRLEGLHREDAQAAMDKRFLAGMQHKAAEGDANRANAVKVADVRSQAVRAGIDLRRELASAANELRRWQTNATEAGKNARTNVMAAATSVAGRAPALADVLRKNQEKLNSARMVANSFANDPTATEEDRQNAALTVEGWQRTVDETKALFDAASRVGQDTANKVAPPKAGAPAPTPGASVEFIRDPVTRKIIRKR